MLFNFLHTRDRGLLEPCRVRAPQSDLNRLHYHCCDYSYYRRTFEIVYLIHSFHRLIHKTFDRLFRFAQPSCWRVIASTSRINQNVYPGSNQRLWVNFRRNYVFVLATKEVNILFLRQLLWQNDKVDKRPRNIYITSSVFCFLYFTKGTKRNS